MKFAYSVLLATVWALAAASPGAAQDGGPDRRGEIVLEAPEYQGVRANAPLPVNIHVRNEGGSDGSGLCVISSILVNGMYQGVRGLESADANGNPGKGSPLWKAAKAAPGGYSPGKLQQLVDRVMPDEPWASYTGTETAVLDRLSSMGYPIGATMNTGALYSYQPIHHMISLVHYSESQDKACVVDNNRPRFYSWMSAKEFARRWIDGGEGWAWVWTRPPAVAAEKRPAGVAVLLLACGLCFLLFSRKGGTPTQERSFAWEPYS